MALALKLDDSAPTIGFVENGRMNGSPPALVWNSSPLSHFHIWSTCLPWIDPQDSLERPSLKRPRQFASVVWNCHSVLRSSFKDKLLNEILFHCSWIWTLRTRPLDEGYTSNLCGIAVLCTHAWPDWLFDQIRKQVDINHLLISRSPTFHVLLLPSLVDAEKCLSTL